METEPAEFLIRFEPSGRSVCVPSGTTLLQAARKADLPVAAACGENLLCGRCGLQILDGGASLRPETAHEQETKAVNRVEAGLRLSCNLEVVSNLVVTAPYW